VPQKKAGCPRIGAGTGELDTAERFARDPELSIGPKLHERTCC
jgi:hypothetical protein